MNAIIILAFVIFCCNGGNSFNGGLLLDNSSVTLTDLSGGNLTAIFP